MMATFQKKFQAAMAALAVILISTLTRLSWADEDPVDKVIDIVGDTADKAGDKKDQILSPFQHIEVFASSFGAIDLFGRNGWHTAIIMFWACVPVIVINWIKPLKLPVQLAIFIPSWIIGIIAGFIWEGFHTYRRIGEYESLNSFVQGSPWVFLGVAMVLWIIATVIQVRAFVIASSRQELPHLLLYGMMGDDEDDEDADEEGAEEDASNSAESAGDNEETNTSTSPPTPPPPAPTVDLKVCPHCRGSIPKDSIFCPRCANRLVAAAPTGTPTGANVGTTAAPTPPAKRIKVRLRDPLKVRLKPL